MQGAVPKTEGWGTSFAGLQLLEGRKEGDGKKKGDRKEGDGREEGKKGKREGEKRKERKETTFLNRQDLH